MRRFVLGVLLLALAACTVRSPQGPEEDPGQAAAPAGREQPFFVGRWASSEAACAAAPWRFTREGLSTPGEVACRFEELTRVPAGYEARATCTAEAPPAPYTIRLSHAESAKALLVAGAPFNDVGLVACPRPAG